MAQDREDYGIIVLYVYTFSSFLSLQEGIVIIAMKIINKSDGHSEGEDSLFQINKITVSAV